MQVENKNKCTISPMVGESSEEEGDGPFFLDEDMESSLSIPLVEFRKPDNIISYVGAKVVRDELQLRRRPHPTEEGRIVYCTMPESPSNNANPKYGPSSLMTQFQANRTLMETLVYGRLHSS